ncbi:hypothetical protein KC363_g7284 [Hortaea werneckii]|uniref:Uncharacterized protein n=1 Tax=Hortaea werneckii TaxID=91943 RepID=A0A3M7EZM4_HORWE|nr:hypothetical protein KC363_g7284 [Hortaea werneckii]KAI7509404.1 hypothetical protein KC347_g5272 [Hortaea werneckii]RMY81980.1 hypothetical protein D0861_08093 [Hortaea werneckii]
MGEKASLQSLLNFRDVGLATGNTAALPAGRLYRAYDIDEASKEDRKCLRESLGITSLIKLWGPYDVITCARRTTGKRGLGWLLVGHTSNLRAVYQSAFERGTGWLKNVADILALSKPQIKAVFEALTQKEVCPVLIYGPHTSLILCLLLSLHGVAEDKISNEYLLTEQNSDALLAYDNANRKAFGLAAKPTYDHPQSFVPDVLDYINAEYHGVDVYLSSIGLTHHQLESVKKNLQGTERSNEKLVDVEEEYVASSFA